MKRILQAAAVTAIALTLNSCGLPGALVRTAGSAVNSVSNVGAGLLAGG